MLNVHGEIYVIDDAHRLNAPCVCKKQSGEMGGSHTNMHGKTKQMVKMKTHTIFL